MGLGTEHTLDEKQLNKLVKKHKITDLTITPLLLIPLINIELDPIVEAANAKGAGLAQLMTATGLSAGYIAKIPWPMVLTEWHLVSMAGSPPNKRFAELYPQRVNPAR
jgi:hypothetical protein